MILNDMVCRLPLFKERGYNLINLIHMFIGYVPSATGIVQADISFLLSQIGIIDAFLISAVPMPFLAEITDPCTVIHSLLTISFGKVRTFLFSVLTGAAELPAQATLIA